MSILFILLLCLLNSLLKYTRRLKDLGQRENFSPADVRKVNEMYQCEKIVQKPSQSTLSQKIRENNYITLPNYRTFFNENNNFIQRFLSWINPLQYRDRLPFFQNFPQSFRY